MIFQKVPPSGERLRRGVREQCSCCHLLRPQLEWHLLSALRIGFLFCLKAYNDYSIFILCSPVSILTIFSLFLISVFLHFCFFNFTLSHQVTYSQILAIRTWMSLKGHYSAHYTEEYSETLVQLHKLWSITIKGLRWMFNFGRF